ncbi:hypothetical protein L6164_018264 [Bauhinia variegata]|uniref:Uncharacterized protein n=1 Tax=Bauhinia variegata TaxID=167791 RepID=A0ACB9NBN7_BAUVA|nr:hypothetical protein L6164_018264 [Bauhinia variegata]
MEKTYGTSLLVPSVKELAQDITSVPTRYIRDPQETLVVPETVKLQEIPVIDMQSLLSQESQDSEVAKLHLACKDWGFFQLVNHGFSSTLLEKVKLETQEFFNLPMSEKKKLWQSSEELEGFGQTFVVSEEQKLDWSDVFVITTFPIHKRKPRLFANLPLPFRDTVELYTQQLNILAMTLYGCMAKALKVEAKEIQELFEEGLQGFRVNYYPPCPEPDKVIGLAPHSDGSGLTIVLQANEVEGLQIRKDGMWLPVKPLPNAFIVNIGDMMEIISNGIYRSIEHRAIVNSVKERLSIATFRFVNHDGEVGPAPSLVTEQTPAQFKRIEATEYLHGAFARKLGGKSYLDTLRT